MTLAENLRSAQPQYGESLHVHDINSRAKSSIVRRRFSLSFEKPSAEKTISRPAPKTLVGRSVPRASDSWEAYLKYSESRVLRPVIRSNGLIPLKIAFFIKNVCSTLRKCDATINPSLVLSLIHISEPTRLGMNSYA